MADSGPITVAQLLSRVQVDLGDSTRQLSDHKSQLDEAQRTTKDFGASTGTMANGVAEAATSVKQLSRDLTDYRDKLAELKQLQSVLGESGGGQQLAGPIKETEAEIARLERQIDALGSTFQQANRTASASFLQTVSSVEQLRTRLQELQALQSRGAAQGIFTPGLAQEIQRTQSALKSVGDEVERTGNQFNISTGHILKYAAAYAVLGQARAVVDDLTKSTLDFQAANVKTVALTDTTAKEMAGLSGEMLNLGAVTGKTAKEIGEGYYFIASSGAKGADGLKVLEASSKAAAAGLGETKVVADAVTSTLNAYQLSGDQATRVTDVLVAAVREGKGEASDFAGSLGRVLPIAAASGVSIEQVAASMATMTRTGLSADESATALRGTLAELERPGTAAQKALAGVGLTADDLRQSIRERGLLATLQELMQRTNGNVETLGVIIPNIRALTGVLSTAGAQAETYSATLQAMQEAHGSTQKAFEETGDSAEFQMARVKAAMEAAAAASTKDLLPSVTQVAQGFADGLNPPVGQSIDQMNKANTEAHKFGEGLAGLLYFVDAMGKSTAYWVGQLGAAADALPRVLPHRAPTTAEQEATASQGAFRINAALDDPNYWRNPDTEVPDRSYRRSQDLNDRIVAAQREAAAKAQGDLTENPPWDFTASMNAAIDRANLGTTGRKLSDALDNLVKQGGFGNDTLITQAKEKVNEEAAAIQKSWEDHIDPTEAAERLRQLNQALINVEQDMTPEAAAAALQLVQQFDQDDRLAAQKKRTETAAREKAAADARALREAHEADPLAGIREGMAKDRNDLIGTAGTVMADLNNAVALKGQQGARAAGEAFAVEASKWGQEIEKAGVPGWEDAFHRLIAAGEVAVTTEAPEMRQAIHDLLAQGEEEIRQANIAKAVASATAKANADMLEAQSRANDELLRAQETAGDQRAQAVQTEADREYDIWAQKQVDRLTAEDRNGRELQRIKEQWGREDADRQEQQLRAQADRDIDAKRAEADRARQAARTLADIQENQSRAQGDLTRSRAREDADALYDHQKRLKEIAKQGGPDVAKATADENASYQQSILDRTRKRQEDDAEATVKRAEQVADAQKRIAEQASDAQLRAGEQASDLRRHQGEQEADIAKARARQLQARKDQDDDQRWLVDQKTKHEQAFYVDAESRAQQKMRDDFARIDATYDHQVAKAAAADELIKAKRQHDIDQAQIQASVAQGEITPDEGQTKLDELNAGYVAQQSSIRDQLRQSDAQINSHLREQISANRPQNPAYANRGALNPSDFLQNTVAPLVSGAHDAISSFWNAIGSPAMHQPFQQQPAQEPLRVVIDPSQLRELAIDLADATSDRPVHLDGERVDDAQAKVRRDRNLARAIG